MLRSICFFFILFTCSNSVIAQCPVSVTITSSPNITSAPVCKGTSVLLTATPSTGVITPQYTWLVDGDTILGAGLSISLLAQGQTVQLFMNTTTGCPSDIDSTSIEIQVVELTETVEIINQSCMPSNTEINITSTGGDSPYNYDLFSFGSSSSGVYNNVPAGSYQLEIIDGNGCRDTNQITIDPKVTLTSTILLDPNNCGQTEPDIELTTIGGSPFYTYELEGFGQSDGSFNSVPLGNYALITTDSQGCMDTTSIAILTEDCDDPFPIEAITPNGDGFNDTWLIRNIQLYPNNKISIFDRWGQRIYQKDGYTNSDAWDGEYLGVGLPVSTYYYVIQVNTESDNQRTFKGPVSIFR